MTSRVLVVGSGAIGLRTSLELIRRKTRVILLSPRHPLHPSTCSMGAGGLWMPFHCDDTRTNGWAMDTLEELMGMVRHVEVVPAIILRRGETCPPGWAVGERSEGLQFQSLGMDDLYEESLKRNFRLPRRDIVDEAGYRHGWLYQAPIVDCPNMLLHMLEELQSSEFVEHMDLDSGKYYESIHDMVDEAKHLGCNRLVNCTGLGSQKICRDDDLVGARGVLLHYPRSSMRWTHDEREDVSESVITVEEPPFGSASGPCYMIPRGGIVAVGGTYLENDEEGEIRDSEREKLLKNARLMGIDTDNTDPVGDWVGFRPYRPTAQLGIDEENSKDGMIVVHNYGYGGSGWTVFVGAAKEAASLL